jgi:nucleoside-diphosphate-sugar epimerase
VARIRTALAELGVEPALAGERLELVTVVELPEVARVGSLAAAADRLEVEDIVHCAGCLDYFDKRNLHLVNVELTSAFLALARELRVRRFTYLSTAYCAGYREDVIPEALHPEPPPAAEPTEYTRTKRMAEWRIATSGLPFAILRPSIVIGDSRTGRYTGKSYGLYQMWRAIEGLLTREYAPIWYTVAPLAPLNFVHEDAFLAAFLAAHRAVPDDAIIHVVSDHAKSPTMRDLCWLWADVYRPREIRCYRSVDDVPLRTIPSRQRRFLELAHKNLEISSRPWRFETTQLDRLRAGGLAFADATLASVTRCQERYIEGSARIQRYIRDHAAHVVERARLIDVEEPSPPPPAAPGPSRS